jgi:hypothetical protein
MQCPCLFPNALAVYDHLFYVIGNGFSWKNGELHEIGFKTKTKEQCIQDVMDDYNERLNNRIEELNEMKNDGVIDEEAFNKFVELHKARYAKNIEKEIYVIEHAKELSENFTPYEGFIFYPFCEGYSECSRIPKDIQPDWLKGINMYNKIREKLIKENPELEERKQ